MENPNNYYVARFSAALVPRVYRFIATLPESERFNLISQMRRSSSSIDDNIREGCSRQSDSAMLPFLYTASGSAGELYGQFKRSRELCVGDQRLANRCTANPAASS
jgi:four helix bundle protein